MNYLQRLKSLEEDIFVGVIGIGSIGKGLMLQAQLTPGMRCVAIADIDLDKAVQWAVECEQDYVIVNTQNELHAAIDKGQLAVCQDGSLLSRTERIQVLIEATSSLAAGGRFGMEALEHNQHLIMMNYEADLMFGPYLMKLAEEKGLVYSVADGDQPTVTKHLIDELEFMGFQLVMAGNMKGYLDRYTNPTLIIPEADKRDLDYRMCSSYTDGTKLCVEMAVLANAYNLRTAVPGMHGPRMENIHDIFNHFDFDALWDGEHGLVDYVLGAKPSGGVFAIGYTDHAYQQHTLAWYPPNMGPGPYYLFYRPYHLGHFEAMRSVAAAVLDGEAVLQPRAGFQTNVYAYAKTDLKEGALLDGLGGYAVYGLIENSEDNEEAPGIPLLLAENVGIKRDIRKDEKILLKDVTYNDKDFAFRLHKKARSV